jgi:ABC-type branched-subunit amino acid transport system substrate-binding protein
MRPTAGARSTRFPGRCGGAAAACTLLFLALAASAGRAEELVVGMSAAFKGPSRGLSIELYRGSLAVFESVNRAGGVHGRKLRIQAYNDNYNPVPAIDNTIKLVEQDHAFVLFDYMGTPTTTRVLPLLKKYKDNGRHVYLLFPFTGAAPQRTYPYDEFVFNLRASYAQETAQLVDHFVGIGRKRLAVFYQIDAYGRSGWDAVRRTLAKYQPDGRPRVDGNRAEPLELAGEATYRRGTPYAESMQAQVDILRAANPDAVVSIGTYSACAAFIRDARNSGWNIPIANVSGVDSDNLLHLLSAEGCKTGRDYTHDLINSQVVPSYNDLRLPAVRNYRQLMEEFRPRPPQNLLDEAYDPPPYSFISFEGFLNAQVLVAVLERMGKDPRPARLKEAFESIGTLDLQIDVPVSFSPTKHQGLDKVYCTVVSDGQFVPLGDQDWQRWRK